MKIAFILPDNYLLSTRKAADEMWPKVQAEYLLYDDYKDTPDMIDKMQCNWDGIIFAGSAPFYYCKKYVQQEVPWRYLPCDNSSFFKSLLIASSRNWNVSHLSIDSFERHVIEDSCREIGVEMKYPLYLGDVTDFEHNDNAICFHIENVKSNRASGCITQLYTVAKELSKEKIPVVCASPALDSIRNQIDRMLQMHRTEGAAEKRFLFFLISIEPPRDYSMALTNEYQFAMERTKLVTGLYKFAKRINGVVFEKSPRECVIISDKDHAELGLDTSRRFELLDDLAANSSYAVKIGIGCGETIIHAQQRAIKANIRANSNKGSVAFCMFSDEKGALFRPSNHAGLSHLDIDEKLLAVAGKSGLCINTAHKLFIFTAEKQSKLFTARELSAYLKISERSTNRLLEKLELADYVHVSGQVSANGKGRPSRLMRFDF